MTARPLPLAAWTGRGSWRVLDTDFQKGELFFQSWAAWRRLSRAPEILHYVAFCATAPSANELLIPTDSDVQCNAELNTQWFGLTAGFHRLMFEQGRVLLTLCVGPTPDLLKQQQFQADAVLAHDWQPEPTGTTASTWGLKALTRCCKRGTTLSFLGAFDQAALRLAMRPLGLRSVAIASDSGQPPSSRLDAIFDPTWDLSRRATKTNVDTTPHCAVIGAGLAGSSAAAALARRGWQVTVLDQGDAPAAGASGLPVGLIAPHVSRDDCTLSQLSRAGVRLMLQQAGEHLISGQDWSATGVWERQIDGLPQLPGQWDQTAAQWSSQSPGIADPVDQALHNALQHHRAGWLKPQRLVQAWLSQPGVRFCPNSPVHALRNKNGLWELLDAAGNILLSVPKVILANADGAQVLLERLQSQMPAWSDKLARVPDTHVMRGLLSWSSHQATPGVDFPAWPVNGAGSIIANIAQAEGSCWYMGSSYQPRDQPERSDLANHQINLEHLKQLFPALADKLAPGFQNDTLLAWKGSRCISTDRLPLVGPVDPDASLWLCAAMGSRGLSLSMLCAELLAAQWCEEPLPIEARLAKSLTALRGRPRDFAAQTAET